MAVVVITSEAQSQFSSLPRPIQARIEWMFVRLGQWPDVSGARALRGDLAGRYRMRTGDYRVQFRVTPADPDREPPKPAVVTVEKVGHRDGFYED